MVSQSPVIISYGGEIVESTNQLSGYTVQNGYTVQAYAGGIVLSTTVEDGGILRISGGTASESSVMTSGWLDCESGLLSDTTLYYGALLDLSGLAKTLTILGATCNLKNGSTASDVAVTSDGILNVAEGAILQHVEIYSGNLTMDGGSASDVEIDSGTAVLGGGARIDGLHLAFAGASLTVNNTGYVRNLIMDGTPAEVNLGGVVCNSELWAVIYEGGEGDIIKASALTLRAGAVHMGSICIDVDSSLIAETGSYIDFTLEGLAPGKAALINDFSRISGTPNYSMSVAENQTAGNYILAEHAAGFASAVTLLCSTYAAMSLTANGSAAVYHNSVYAMTLNESGRLAVSVTDYQIAVDGNTLIWDDINSAENYVLSFTDGNTVTALEVATQGAELLGLAEGNYAWGVRSSAESDNWQDGEDFTRSAVSGPQKYSAVTNDAEDIFFARSTGTWSAGYEARNVGNAFWEGTGDVAALKGKARITDIFAGSDDASTLVLEETTGIGAAMFVDDIYSAASGTSEQARLSKIDIIYATAGDDIIDLTSQSFEFANGVTVYGGNGNDVIWANSKENTLFGEAGDDRIVGGNEDDVIIGGIGNDTLHGGGGADIFCFGDDWGIDTVEQLASGSVVLWFNENSGTWDEANLIYTQGDNFVSVSGVTSVELRFGAAEGHEEQYAALSASGAFA